MHIDLNDPAQLTPEQVRHLLSEGNDRVTQLQSGRAYVRAQLAATAAGLSMQPLSQALQEYPEVQAQYREIHERTGVSVTTTGRVARTLEHGHRGYAAAIDRLASR